MESQPIHWKPTEKQATALRQPADEILYGGARGGGKTDAGMAWLLYNKDHPRFRGLVIRRNADDLKDWLDRAKRMYAHTGAVFIGSPGEITFPSGAKIRLGHLKDEGAYTKYQGHEYQNMLLEELTHIPSEKLYEALIGSCRSTVPELRPQIFATTNPDGPGHYWVKERFKCEQPDGKIRTYRDEQTGLVKTRVFITAMIEDNKHLVEADPGYVAYLNNIQDENLRKQWRLGSWEDPNIEGAYYGKQIAKALKDGRITRVPYDEYVPVYTFWDLGISDAMCIWFVQLVNKEIRFIDYVEVEGEGFPYFAKVLEEKGYRYAEHYAPHDIVNRELGSGSSRLEAAAKLGINFQVVPKLEIADGIDAARSIFSQCWFDEVKCAKGIKALKNYHKEYDEKREIYRDRPEHDWSSHGADGFRYFAVRYRSLIEDLAVNDVLAMQVSMNRPPTYK